MDVVLCYAPKLDIDTPILGLPILKAKLTENGYKSIIVDLNMKLYQDYQQLFNVNSWEELDSVFLKSPDDLKVIDTDRWVSKLLSYNSKFIAFSAFSSHNTNMIKILASKIKSISPNTKTILGGPNTQWAIRELQEYIDYYVIGYGEEAIIDIMKGTFQNIDIPQKRIDMSLSPTPDFSDLPLEKYNSKNLFYTYLTRGCTQHCKFCDVNNIWNGYNSRNVERVITDMYNINKQYKKSRFAFCDSLVNADYKLLRKLCIELSKYNFRWEGMFRIRKTKPDIYDLLKSSGCYLLKIGIESGSEKVRKLMNKHFTNEQVLETLYNLKRVGIKCDLFFMTGYPGETEDDFNKTKKVILSYVEEGYFDIIDKIRISATYFRKEELKTMSADIGYINRFNRYHELRQYITELGFTIRRDKKMLVSIKTRKNSNEI